MRRSIKKFFSWVTLASFGMTPMVQAMPGDIYSLLNKEKYSVQSSQDIDRFEEDLMSSKLQGNDVYIETEDGDLINYLEQTEAEQEALVNVLLSHGVDISNPTAFKEGVVTYIKEIRTAQKEAVANLQRYEIPIEGSDTIAPTKATLNGNYNAETHKYELTINSVTDDKGTNYTGQLFLNVKDGETGSYTYQMLEVKVGELIELNLTTGTYLVELSTGAESFYSEQITVETQDIPNMDVIVDKENSTHSFSMRIGTSNDVRVSSVRVVNDIKFINSDTGKSDTASRGITVEITNPEDGSLILTHQVPMSNDENIALDGVYEKVMVKLSYSDQVIVEEEVRCNFVADEIVSSKVDAYSTGEKYGEYLVTVTIDTQDFNDIIMPVILKVNNGPVQLEYEGKSGEPFKITLPTNGKIEGQMFTKDSNFINSFELDVNNPPVDDVQISSESIRKDGKVVKESVLQATYGGEAVPDGVQFTLSYNNGHYEDSYTVRTGEKFEILASLPSTFDVSFTQTGYSEPIVKQIAITPTDFVEDVGELEIATNGQLGYFYLYFPFTIANQQASIYQSIATVDGYKVTISDEDGEVFTQNIDNSYDFEQSMEANEDKMYCGVNLTKNYDSGTDFQEILKARIELADGRVFERELTGTALDELKKPVVGPIDYRDGVELPEEDIELPLLPEELPDEEPVLPNLPEEEPELPILPELPDEELPELPTLPEEELPELPTLPEEESDKFNYDDIDLAPERKEEDMEEEEFE